MIGTIRVRTFVLAASLVLLAGCAADPLVNTMGPSGTLQIIHISRDLERQVDSGELFIAGNPPDTAMTLTRFNGQDALAMVAGEKPFALARSVDALMTTTPYLEWSWAAERPTNTAVPVAIAVGLHDHSLNDSPDTIETDVLGFDIAPSHHLIVGEWRRSPLQRGHLKAFSEDPRVALYGVRGGGPVAAWHRDGIDIEALFRRSWPEIDPGDIRIAYVAVAVLAGEGRVYLADVVLHR